MKIKKFNENNIDLNISGIKCDNPKCNYNDPSVSFDDYKSYVNKPCPECGENLLTQDGYDQSLQIVQAVELMNKMKPEDIDKLTAGLSEDEIDQALDFMNQMKMRKEGEVDGKEHWTGSFGKDTRPPRNESIKPFKDFQ